METCQHAIDGTCYSLYVCVDDYLLFLSWCISTFDWVSTLTLVLDCYLDSSSLPSYSVIIRPSSLFRRSSFSSTSILSSDINDKLGCRWYLNRSQTHIMESCWTSLSVLISQWMILRYTNIDNLRYRSIRMCHLSRSCSYTIWIFKWLLVISYPLIC